MGKKRKNKNPKDPSLSEGQRAGLAKIRRLRAWFWGWAASYLPVGYLLTRERWKTAFIVFIVVWTGALAISVLRLRAAVCPRCGGLYHSRRTGSGFSRGMTLGRQCLNCGLALNADRVAGPA